MADLARPPSAAATPPAPIDGQASDHPANGPPAAAHPAEAQSNNMSRSQSSGAAPPNPNAPPTAPAPVPAPPAVSTAASTAVAAAAVAAATGPTPRQLNVKDALSYLDQVKVQFSESPGVYNQFLDIMKDFKTQNIDTPGVIQRVSSLFRGHPTLIEGFNTFLPPGYHIDVETPKNNDLLGPHAYSIITVTHPQGVQTQSRLSLHGGPEELQQHSLGAANAAAAPSQGGGPPVAGPAPGGIRLGSLPPHASGLLANPDADTPLATPGASLVLGMRANGTAAVGPPSAIGQDSAANEPKQQGAKPLEFNHAISYVNKIKNRYANEPQTYQTFLDILQRYQRDTRPLSESFPQVYEQVNQLFRGAPDLLAEFMQFLPDPAQSAPPQPPTFGGPPAGGLGAAGGYAGPSGSSADAKSLFAATAGQPGGPRRKSDIAGGGGLAGPTSLGGVGRSRAHEAEGPSPPKKKRGGAAAAGAQAPPARAMAPEIDMTSIDEPMQPPVPGPAPRGTKRKQRASKSEVVPLASANVPPPMFAPPGYPTIGAAYYAMQEANQKAARSLPRVIAAREELTFFQHVKEYFGDRRTYHEFLKLVNLFTQDIIDLAALVHRARPFLVGSPDLFGRFMDIVGWKEGAVGPRGIFVENGKRIIENVPAAASARPDLSDAPECGPSYRKLPESDVSLNCSGRDQLCWNVLNDVWVCGPFNCSTEDNMFLVKQTNAFERALFQAEDERHEYDYHIEANNRTIALLEPINVRIQQMEPEHRAEFRLKPGLGGQSKSIYQRIIKKVYGKEQGMEVIQALHDNPCLAVPIVLARLKQKDDEWKRALREWNRVWREVDAKNYWKALDHQGITFKTADKKALSQKTLVGEVEILKREQQQKRIGSIDPNAVATAPVYQLDLDFEDRDVFFDVLRLLVHFLDHANAAGLDDELKDKIEAVIRHCVTSFFAIPEEELDLQLTPLPPDRRDAHGDLDGNETPLSDGDASDTGASALAEDERPLSGRGRKRGGGDLRKKVMRNAMAPIDRATRRAGADSRGVSPAPSSSIADEPLAALVVEPVASASRDVESQAPVEVSSIRNDGEGVVDGVDRTLIAATVPSAVESEQKDAPDTTMQEATSPPRETPQVEADADPKASRQPTPADATSKSPQLKRVNLFANNGYYCFVRLLHIFYSRLATLKKQSNNTPNPLTTAIATAPIMNPAGPSSLMQKHIIPSLPAPIQTPAKPSEYYPALLALVQGFNSGEIELQAFEEGCRILYPTKSYVVSTVDKVCQALVKILSKIALDDSATAVMQLFDGYRALKRPTAAQTLAYRRNVEANTGGAVDANVFRLEWLPAIRHVRVQLTSRDEIAQEDLASAEKSWAEYIESWMDVANIPTIGLEDVKIHAPFLKRNLVQAQEGNRQADPSLFASRSALGIRVCMRSYRLFFSPGTEEYLARRPMPPPAISSVRDDTVMADAEAPAAIVAPSTEAITKGRKRRWDRVLKDLTAKAELGSSSQKPVEVADSPAPTLPATTAEPTVPGGPADSASDSIPAASTVLPASEPSIAPSAPDVAAPASSEPAEVSVPAGDPAPTA